MRNPHPGTKQKIGDFSHDPVALQKYLRHKWATKPRLLSLSAPAPLLGYTVNALHDWRRAGLLEVFGVAGESMVTKDDLIHCIATRNMQLRPSHSEKHRKLMESFIKWQADQT